MPFILRSSRPPAGVRPGLLALGLTLMAQGPAAQAEDCRLALVLALDVSGSVSATEDRLQRGGLAAALLAPEVSRAALTGGPVALYAFEWAGASYQAPVLPGWQLIGSEQDLARVAGAIGQPRGTAYQPAERAADGTAVGAALVHAAAALAAGPDCRERTVDVSGDGVNSQGVEPATVIEHLYDGVTVNALVIDEPFDDPMLEMRHGGDQPLAAWFMGAVVHGPGAFHVLADGYEDYERAMTAKLLRELEPPLVSELPLVESGA